MDRLVNSALEVFDDTPARRLTIDDIAVGQAVVQRVRFDSAMMMAFDRVARDRAPVHNDPRFARTLGFNRPIIQGLALLSRFSRLIGMYLPGELAILESIEVKFHRPVHIECEIIYRAEVERVFRPMQIVELVLSISFDGVAHVRGGCRCLVR